MLMGVEISGVCVLGQNVVFVRIIPRSSGVPRNFFRGVQQIQLRTEDRENGDLGAVATQSGVLEAAVFWYK